jgi:aryl-alcohol dehydrogenase-like predicted oxidoreductase
MIEKSKLGNDGPQVGRLGYGAMVLEGYYGDSDDDSAVKTLLHAIDSGMMIDSADAYGNGHNESLVAKALKSSTMDAFVATKFGIVFDENAKALSVQLDASTLQRIDEVAKPGLAEGATLV